MALSNGASELKAGPGAQAAAGAKLSALFAGTMGPLIGLVLLCLALSLTTDTFLTVRNILNVLDQVTVLGIMAIGMTLVILIGGIDLSVGSVLALAAMVMGFVAHPDHLNLGMPAGIVTALVVAGLCGLVSGLLVTVTKLPPFIATLAMMSVARGLANMITDGSQIIGFPDWFTSLSIIRHFGFLSVTVGLMIVLAIIFAIFLNYRATGRSLYAIGGSAEVARLSGIPVNSLTNWVYAICGVLAGLAGIVLAARLDSVQPSSGFGYELDTIAAVVIGGASLSGGVGSIGGTAIGVLIIGVLRNGLNLLGVSPFIQQVVIGVVIALAVATDTWRRRTQ
ncbi:ABC transporter permease [Mesorhizobium sp.]|uniref:ABC transporter permease n=2 Tax=unclassified Mesorhizobium TaxID=325217 RepID=UPI00120A369C|nr:ABC transporter permease [Mesorhizobium sp.]TIM81576.1 MAG: ABC transporter permease [Mesorhizobium sp.]